MKAAYNRLMSLRFNRRQEEKMRLAVVLLCLCALVGITAPVQAKEGDASSGDEIVTALLSNNARRTTQLKEYTSTRNYEVDYQGFPTGHKHANMVVRVSYKAPHQKSFEITSESGSKLLLDHVLHKLIATEQETNNEKALKESELSRSNYNFQFLGRENRDSRDCYVFYLKPLHNNKLLYEGKIWVDAQEYAVTHIDAHPAKSPSFWISQTEIEHQYDKIGDYWLPVHNRSTSKVRFGGKSLLTIEYKDYHLQAEQSMATPVTGQR
jgi:outer membrane lipoprotein-sorting protein